VDEGWLDSNAGPVYGAAMAVSGDQAVALEVAREILAAGPGPMPVGRALVMAARRADAGPFARIAPIDRDGALAIGSGEVKRRLLSGVRALAEPPVTGGVLRTLRPRTGFGNGASPARGARAS
jgi:hypothetical protein